MTFAGVRACQGITAVGGDADISVWVHRARLQQNVLNVIFCVIVFRVALKLRVATLYDPRERLRLRTS